MTFFLVITGVVIIIGAVGGLINAFLSDSGGFWPRPPERVGRSTKKIWKLGGFGNMVFGAAAAFISWGLYGPFPLTSPPKFTLVLSTFVGAFLVGIGGSRIITSELEKRILTAAASTAAEAPADPQLAVDIATASSPTEALGAATDAKERAAENAEAQKPAAKV